MYVNVWTKVLENHCPKNHHHEDLLSRWLVRSLVAALALDRSGD